MAKTTPRTVYGKSPELMRTWLKKSTLLDAKLIDSWSPELLKKNFLHYTKNVVFTASR